MENYLVLILGSITFLSLVHGQGPVILAVEPSKVDRVSGDEPTDIVMTCTVNVDLVKLITHYRVTWISPDGTELNNLNDALDGVDRNKYQFDLNNDKGVHLQMVVKSVTDDDGGRYTCRVTDKSYESPQYAYVNVNVLYDVSKVYLKVGGQKFTEYTTDQIQLLQNKYKVQCHAEGSNPQADIKMILGFKDGIKKPVVIKSLTSIPEDFGPHLQKFEVHAEKQVELLPGHNEITCEIQVPKGGFAAKTVGVGLHIVPVEPEITCENMTAILNEENVYLKCSIEAFHEPTKYIWIQGDTNDELTNTDENGDGNHVVTFDSTTTELGKHKIDAILEIKKATKDVFDRSYYLEVEAGHGNTYQQIVSIKQIQPNSGSSVLRLTLSVCVLSFLAALLH